MAADERKLDVDGSHVIVCPNAEAASRLAADRIAAIIEAAERDRSKAVLGLATGATPETVYAELAARHRAGSLSFQKVVTYNLDEYYPIQPLDPLSYRHYMHQRLFSLVDIPANQTHVIDGTVPAAFAAEHAAQFDRWIEADGGLDLQLLGIGRNGHIGFNEPSDLSVEEAINLPTRPVELHPVTTTDAVREFGSAEKVITQALTVGIKTILAARVILMLATGPRKAEIVARSLKGPITPTVPASLLRTVAEKVVWILDEPAAAELG